jgi:hypothetical protein
MIIAISRPLAIVGQLCRVPSEQSQLERQDEQSLPKG